MTDTKSIGRNIDSFCGKCKLTTDHTIMTMEGETVARVRCKSCGGTHKFRDPLVALKVRKPRSKKGPGEAATAEILWEAGLAAARGKEHEYNMAAKYRIGDIVIHDAFGKGVVTKLYANKCEMLFKDKERLMASTNE